MTMMDEPVSPSHNMIPLDSLQQDHATLTEILTARRAVTAVPLPVGVRTGRNPERKTFHD
jgi:hypothetical protein